MISQSVISCLDQHHQKFPMLQESLDKITQFYKEKLWHNLTDYLLDYSKQKTFDDGEDLIELYNLMIKDLYGKINPLKYALITIYVSRQFSNLEDAIKFLEEAKTRLSGKTDAAFLCQIAQAEKKLNLGLHHDCFEILNTVKKSLEALSDVDARVFANLSQAYSLYYRRKEDHENFYHSSMSYLAYTPTSELTQEEKKDLSIKIGMSILLGKNIYNITELLDKEILSSLKGTDFEWLYDLLQSLGQGHINSFEEAVRNHHEFVSRYPQILNELDHLKQKVRIIAFLELLFECDKDDRSLKFNRIAQHCQLAKEDVELLLMKAMSLGLVRGMIDEVDEVAHIDWIMPRYLNLNHLRIMTDKLRDWEDKLTGVINICSDSQQKNNL